MIDRYKFYYRLMMIAFWLMAGLFIMDLVPQLGVIRTAVRLISDAIFVCLGVKVLHDRRDIAIIITIVLFTFISSIVCNHLTLVYWLNGLREFIGWMFIFPILRWFMQPEFRDRFISDFDRFVYVYLWLQVPCLVLQFLLYGANDAGGGTWGYGCSGIVSITICFGSYYLMTRRWNTALSYWENIKNNRILIFLLFPTLLNETKIVFFLIPIYFLMLIKINRAFGLKVLAASPLILLFLIGFGWLYLTASGQVNDEVFTTENISLYMTGGDESIEIMDLAEAIRDNPELSDDAEASVWNVDLPRVLKLMIMGEAVDESDGGRWFGSGGSLFKATSFLTPTHYAKEHEWMYRGTKPYLFFIFMQFGWVGLFIMLIIAFKVIEFKNSRKSYFALGIKIYFSLLFLGLLLYNDAWENCAFCMFIFTPLFLSSYLTTPPYNSVKQ